MTETTSSPLNNVINRIEVHRRLHGWLQPQRAANLRSLDGSPGKRLDADAVSPVGASMPAIGA